MDIALELSPGPRAPAEARDAVDRLEGDLSDDLLDEIRLIVTELVSNAVVHGPAWGPILVHLWVLGPGHVRGDVRDQGDGSIEMSATAGEGGGWGLRLIDRLTQRWGVDDGSTHVWFELTDGVGGR